jgi:cysteine synthase B
VAGLGTSGTFVGTGRALKAYNPSIHLTAFQPDAPFHGLEGLKHMATAIVPKIYDPKLADEDFPIATEDAYRMAKRLAREEGLLVGISSGAACCAALKVAKSLGKGHVVVTIFPDKGEHYLSSDLFSDKRWTQNSKS